MFYKIYNKIFKFGIHNKFGLKLRKIEFLEEFRFIKLISMI